MSEYGGLLVLRARWTLTFRGKLLASVLIVVLAFGAISEAFPFLAVNHPVHGDVMVLEGWIPLYTLNQAADAFRNGEYRRLLVIRSFDVDEGKSIAVMNTLLNQGLSPSSVEMIYHPEPRKDRTYHSALAVREWLAEHKISVGSLDAVTVGPHARRSWLMFEKAFDNSATIGIIALDDAAYDAQHWWRTSEGVREVVGEAIAYIYAKVFFVWN